jgi:RNA polymerase sigma factor (sigma-70 family)
MRTMEAEGRTLEEMWAAHREAVRRVLLALTRDLDLADDLLQDTYLRARQGIGTYRGGDPRAWLTTIARNVYRSHARLRRSSAEVPSGQPEAGEEQPAVDLLTLLAIRQALADLPAALRTALVMKHYAGFTYQEIARHQHCPVGTAKWRVSDALDRLRLVLVERRTAVASAEAHEIALVDYVYGLLPPEEAEQMRAHLAEHEDCRREAEDLRQVVSALGALEGEHKQMHLLELDREGRVTLYVTGSHLNDTGETITTSIFHSGRGGKLQHFYQDGEEAAFTVKPSTPSEGVEPWEELDTYTVALPHPVPPGGRVNELSVYPTDAMPTAGNLGGGRFRLHWKQSPGPQTAYVQVIRLPAGAQLVTADPPPAETKTNGTTTLVWRTVLARNRAFECTVEYRLDGAT